MSESPDIPARGLVPAAPVTQEQRLALRGGLRGRLSEEFCILQCQIDALKRCVENDPPLVNRADLLTLLDEMTPHIRRLERLSDHAADLAFGTALCGRRQLVPLDLVWYIREFCQIANEELAASGSALRVRFQQQVGNLWAEADERLVDGILANLLSNAVAARAKSMTLQASERCLSYRDDGPGPSPAVRALLRDGSLQKELLNQGGTGLLIVREYAAAMQWTLFLSDGDGLAVDFQLPVWNKQPELVELRDGSVERSLRARRQRSVLRREFAAL